MDTSAVNRCVFFKVAIVLLPKNGTIDLRSRFQLGDTDHAADLLQVSSGNDTALYSRPQWFISYYLLP